MKMIFSNSNTNNTIQTQTQPPTTNIMTSSPISYSSNISSQQKSSFLFSSMFSISQNTIHCATCNKYFQ